MIKLSFYTTLFIFTASLALANDFDVESESNIEEVVENAIENFDSEYATENISNCGLLKDFAKKAVWSLKDPKAKGDYILADKSRRLLHILSEGKVIRTYRMALGKNPTGHKQCEGDSRTPEGIYDIGYKNSASDYHLSLAVSYPNQNDINKARKLGCDPGGDIMIHGLPNSAFKRAFIKHPKDWTKGCMAVKNSEVEEIWRLINKGTTIEICK